MREIKFRAWNIEEKTIWNRVEQVYDYICWDKYNNWDNIPCTCFSDLLDSDNWVIMQYTGLKDKNWKEIYEGDIVWDWNDIAWIDTYSSVEYDNESSWFIVYTPWLIIPLYDALQDWNSTDAMTWRDTSWAYKVWNIYENPELLK